MWFGPLDNAATLAAKASTIATSATSALAPAIKRTRSNKLSIVLDTTFARMGSFRDAGALKDCSIRRTLRAREFACSP